MECAQYRYGPDPSQYAELYVPARRRYAAVVVIIHGGYWRAAYGAELGRPLARDLAERGWVCWNIEYRRVGNGGGWPQTFDDVASAVDLLAEVAQQTGVAAQRVVGLGHSAGGHLAVWAAGRGRVPSGLTVAHMPGGEPRVQFDAVLSQSGVLDLARAQELGLSNGAVQNLLGPQEASGTEGADPYRLADPMRNLPQPVPVYAIHADQDTDVPKELSERYVAAARAAGGTAELLTVPGDHSALIDPGSAAFERIRQLLADIG